MISKDFLLLTFWLILAFVAIITIWVRTGKDYKGRVIPPTIFFSGIGALIISIIFYVLSYIGMVKHNGVPIQNERVSMRMKHDYLSYKVIETDSTITLQFFTEEDSLIYNR